MPGEADEEKLNLALSVSDAAQVDEVLSRLNAMPEPRRRRVLRPHWEDPRGITDPGDIALRQGFSSALYQLAALELGASTGYLELTAVAGEFDRRMRELLKSRAVARFIDDYDCFQIRFLIDRISLTGLELSHLPSPPALGVSRERNETVRVFLKQTLLLQSKSAVRQLDGFLDDYPFVGIEKGRQQERFRAWLADAAAEHENEVLDYFSGLKSALTEWAVARYMSYREVTEPVLARLAIFDICWLIRLFNAEISPFGELSYRGTSWLTLLADSPHLEGERRELLEARRTLRRALTLACDWIRGEAQEEGSACAGHAVNAKFAPVPWMDAFKSELQEIIAQRAERDLSHSSSDGVPEHFPMIRHGLVGLAFSGSSIRSATFNLGVLEALKENDLLRFVDYLSTVSGGGYIGGWLVANAKRDGYWTRREADWQESVKYLRDFSNSLSIRLSFLSVDTWTMWTTFARNTIQLLLQFSLAISACLLIPYFLRFLFDWLLVPNGQPSYLTPQFLSAILLVLATMLVCASLFSPRRATIGRAHRTPAWSQRSIALVVLLLSPAFLAVTAVLWQAAGTFEKSHLSYAQILVQVIGAPDMQFVLAGAYVALAAVAFASVTWNWKGVIAVALVPAGGLAALLLGVSACVLLLQEWTPHSHAGPIERGFGGGFEAAFVCGPALLIVVLILSIDMLLRLLGRASRQEPREWWNRFFALLSITGAGWLTLSAAAIYGPYWFGRNLGVLMSAPICGWLVKRMAKVLENKLRKAFEDEPGTGPSKTSQLSLRALVVAGRFVGIAGLVIFLSVALQAVLMVFSPTVGPSVSYWEALRIIRLESVFATLAIALSVGFLLSWRVNVNSFGLSEFYTSRLVRCYLGATRERRSPHPFTGFDEKDDMPLASVRTVTPPPYRVPEPDESRAAPFSGPFPIVNFALNLGDSSDLAVKTRQSASFTMTPLHCGFHRERSMGGRRAVGAYSPIERYCREESPSLGLALSVSGAAANPYMGYDTSPLTSFLLAVFNPRPCCWFANPATKQQEGRFSPPVAFPVLLKELLGRVDDTSAFVEISDGRLFENLGVYELVRRRCRLVIASDAEEDPEVRLENLQKLIRLCEVDFGVKFSIDASLLDRDPRTGRSEHPCAVGRIEYGNGSLGTLIYMKASLPEKAGASILQHQSEHSASPHETSVHQLFNEDQFETYRKLGYECAKRTFRDAALDAVDDFSLEQFAQQLTDIWTPAKRSAASPTSNTTALSRLWQTLGTDPNLLRLSNEILCHTPPRPGPPSVITAREYYFCSEILQLMEDAYLDLHLDDAWDDAGNAGWKDLFLKLSRSATFRIVWEKSCGASGRPFRYFCRRKLNLK
jgi:hypothetical protein